MTGQGGVRNQVSVLQKRCEWKRALAVSLLEKLITYIVL